MLAGSFLYVLTLSFSPFTPSTDEPPILTPSPARKSLGTVPIVGKVMRMYTLSTLTHSPTASDHWRSTCVSPEVSIHQAAFSGAAGSSLCTQSASTAVPSKRHISYTALWGR